jgi:hypothetical protein
MSRKLLIIGVSLLAAAVLTVGVGTAQATLKTTICTTSNLPGLVCPSADQRASGTVYKAVASGMNAIENSAGEFLSCTGSTIEFETLAQAAAPLPAEVKSWPLSGCTDTTSGLSCSSFFGPVPPYSMSIQNTGSDHGSVKVTDWTNILLKYVCGSGPGKVNCVFETPVIELETSSLTPAVASMSASMTLNSGNSSCGKFSKLVGSFTFTYPSPDTFFVEHD